MLEDDPVVVVHVVHPRACPRDRLGAPEAQREAALVDGDDAGRAAAEGGLDDDAMRHRHEDMAKFLRASGGRVGVADLQLALITDSSLGEVESVEMLLSDGAKPSKGDYDKRTALHLAASEGWLEGVAYLVAGAGALGGIPEARRALPTS